MWWTTSTRSTTSSRTNYQSKIADLREAHMKSVNEMEELKRFQGSRFDEFSRRRLIESQDTKSVRSGLSHVPSQPASLPPFRDPGGMLSRSVGKLSRNDKPPDIWDTHGTSGNVLCKSTGVFLSTLSARVQSVDFQRNGRHITACNEWTPNTRHNFGSEMPVRTVSRKFIRPQRGKIFKGLQGRPTKTADFRSLFWQLLHANNICLLEDKIQDWGMYLFTISYWSYALDQRSGDGWFSGWSKIFVFCSRSSNARFWSTWCEDCFSTEQNHP